MITSLFSNLGFIYLLLVIIHLSLSSPINPAENHHRASLGSVVVDNPLVDARDFLSQFLSTLNLTKLRPQTRQIAAHKEPPEYMLELYNRFANDRTAVPSANIVRSFNNEDSSPYGITPRGIRIYPLLFNISLPHHERITLAELRLFTLVWKELVTKHIHAKDNSWVSFELTHVVTLWRKSGCATHRLEVHLEAETLVDIDRSLDGKQNTIMIVFSDDQSRDRKQDKQELIQMINHENDLPENMGRGQEPFWEHVNHKNSHAKQDELNHESCKRTPLFVDFKDIGWDSWIIQPLGYEAYKCNGVCNPPLTSEVSPTKHAIVQTLLSIKNPDRAPRACCVPTKLEPISLLYHDNGAITFNHKYEGMVVAECGCR
uniref:Bone morphogenetic protein 10, like n=1 Tax=Astatotilapia calliptera TaxID=8154 RepID=A0AAX7UQL9_ASTCA